MRINDVLAIGPDSFYVTNWIYSFSKEMIFLEATVAQMAWSNIAFYDNGRVSVVADGFTMANGLNVSPDKK